MKPTRSTCFFKFCGLEGNFRTIEAPNKDWNTGGASCGKAGDTVNSGRLLTGGRESSQAMNRGT
jgi:hypothetical protein